MKGKKLKGSPKKKEGKKKNPWSDSDVSDVEGPNSFIFQRTLLSYTPIIVHLMCAVNIDEQLQAAIYLMRWTMLLWRQEKR